MPAEGHKKLPGSGSSEFTNFIGTLCKRASMDSGINGIAAVFGTAWIRGICAFLILGFAHRVMRFIPINTLRASIETGKQRGGQQNQ